MLMPLPSLQVLRMLSFVHLRVQIPRMMLFTLESFAGPPTGNLYKYKVKLVVQRNSKPKILAAECDKICPAGKSCCCCHIMVVIWKLDDLSRNKNVQPTDNRSCTSKPRKWGIPGKTIVQHKPIMTETF